MKKCFSLFITWLAVLALTATSTAPAVFAATPALPQNNPAKQGQALEIAPPVITLSVNPGQTVKTQVYLRNISSGNLIVTGQANDFVASGEDGTPKLLIDKDSSGNPYALKPWIGALPSLQMIPREIKTMPVTISVPANASPGGHYGVIRFTATPADLQGTGVSLSASLGALVLLTVNGKTNENLSVAEFSVNHSGKTSNFFEAGSIQFLERLRNTGNVHLQPTGQVTVKDMFGKKIAAVNVNLPPRNILPDSIRKFEQPLDKSVIGNKKLFGRYTADLSLTYGTSKKTLNDSLTFWVIPYKLIAAIAVLLVAAFFGIRILIRRYNRRIIAKAERRGRGPGPGPHNPQGPYGPGGPQQRS